MPDQFIAPFVLPCGIALRHVHGPEALAACFPAIARLHPRLQGLQVWIERASEMAADGYRILAACEGENVLAMAGYRVMENLVHGHILCVDVLVAVEGERGNDLRTALLAELSLIGADEDCDCLILPSPTTDEKIRGFCESEGLVDTARVFRKLLKPA